MTSLSKRLAISFVALSFLAASCTVAEATPTATHEQVEPTHPEAGAQRSLMFTIRRHRSIRRRIHSY